MSEDANVRALNVSEIIDRMKEASAIRTDAELANHIGVSNKTISSWRSRNSLPIEAIIQIAIESNNNVEFFLWGDKGIKRYDTDLSFSDLRVDDFEIAGSVVLSEILRKFAKERLDFMNDDEIRVHGEDIGIVIMAALGRVRRERRALLDTGKMDQETFDEYARKALRIDLPHYNRAITNLNARRNKGPQ